WPSGERRFAAGERIHTENSYKYRPEAFTALLDAAGFGEGKHWTDRRGWCSVFLARASQTHGAFHAANRNAVQAGPTARAVLRRPLPGCAQPDRAPGSATVG